MYTVPGCIRRIQYSVCSKVCTFYNVQPRKQTPFCIAHYVCHGMLQYKVDMQSCEIQYVQHSLSSKALSQSVRSIICMMYYVLQTIECRVYFSIVYYSVVYEASTLWSSTAEVCKTKYSAELRSMHVQCSMETEGIIQYSSFSTYSTICKEQSDNAICKVCTVVSCSMESLMYIMQYVQ